MKVLQVNCVYKIGSTGKIVYDIHKELQKEGIESVVCYGRIQKEMETNVYKVSSEIASKLNNCWSRVTGLLYGGNFFATKRLIRIIEKEKPDIVHLQCINGYFINIYKLVEYLKNSGIKTVVSLHAEFMHTGNCGHAFDCENWKTGCGNCPRLWLETKSLFLDRTATSFRKMQAAFDGFDEKLRVTAVSPWLMERAKMSSILRDKKLCVILNGVNTDIFKGYDTEEQKEKIIFHATPSFDIKEDSNKGGRYLVELAKRFADKPIKIIVAGRYDQSVTYPENMELLGQVMDQETLAKYYAMADVTVITSKRETFSMVCAESLCCGTPVVGFKAGGPEQIALKEYSAFAEYGDIDQLEREVLNQLFQVENNPKEIAKQAGSTYSKQVMAQNYIDVYKRLMQE